MKHLTGVDPGKGLGGAGRVPAHLIFRSNLGPKVGKNLFETARPLSQDLDNRPAPPPPPPLSEGLDPPRYI